MTRRGNTNTRKRQRTIAYVTRKLIGLRIGDRVRITSPHWLGPRIGVIGEQDHINPERWLVYTNALSRHHNSYFDERELEPA